MAKWLLLVVLGLVGVLLAVGQIARAAAGPEPNDIQDSLPVWTSDGSRVLFERTAATGLQHPITMRPSGKDLYVAWFAGELRGTVANSPYLLVEAGSDTILTVGGRFAGSSAEVHGTDASASPDGTQVAYLRDGTLYVARLDQIPVNAFPIFVPPETAIATGIAPPPGTNVTGPAWSPDGEQILIASGASLLLVQADGSGTSVVVDGPHENDNPSWAPDGKTIAFERNMGSSWEVWLDTPGCTVCARPFGGAASADNRFPRFAPVGDRLAFISNRQHLKGGATPYQYALYTEALDSRVAHKLLDDVHPYSPPSWSPTAAFVAVSAGQECRRWGIYVGRPETGSQFDRSSNVCRFDGTPGADRIHSSPYFDIVNGFGGNDYLDGYLGNDKILGGNGNDALLGNAGNDVIFGGSGNDVIFGGPGNDVIVGGPGRDRIDCGTGNDTVEGADRLDRIARNCEHVRR